MSITLTSVHDFRLDLRVPFFGLVSNVESSTVFIDSNGKPTSWAEIVFNL